MKPDGVVSTIAGSPGITGNVNGIGSVARFNEPEGLAIDKSGNIFLAATMNYSVRGITPNARVSTLGTSFYCPVGIAADRFGNVYVADCLNERICKGVPQP